MSPVMAELEEAVMMQELMLQSLLKRHELVSNQKGGMQTRLAENLDDYENLQFTKQRLESSLQQHLQLQNELEHQLIKIDQKYATKCGPTTMPMLSLVENTTSSDDDEHATSTTATTNDELAVQDVESQGESETEEKMIMSGAEVGDNQDAANAAAVAATHCFSTNGLMPLHSFTLHSMVHGERLKDIMAFLVEQYQLLDDTYAHNGNHRRFGLEYSILMPNVFEHSNNQRDPNNPTADADDSLVDHSTALCPYELAGECADPFCTYQHLKKRKVQGRQLVKELLSLANVRLPKIVQQKGHVEVDSHVEDESDHSMLMDVEVESGTPNPDQHVDQDKILDSSPAAKRYRLSVESALVQHADESAKSQPILDFDQDYIDLPLAPVDSPSIDQDDSSLETILSSPNIPSYWWMTAEDRQRVATAWPKEGHLSVTGWMETVFNFHMEESAILRLPANELQNTNLIAFNTLKSIGRVADALQLLLHAGRYDWIALISKQLELIPESDFHLFDTTTMKLVQIKLFQKFFQRFPDWLFEKEEEDHRGSSSSIFESTFRTQLSLWCMSEWIHVTHDHLSESVHDSWGELLIQILDRFPATDTNKVMEDYGATNMVGFALIVREISCVFCGERQQAQKTTSTPTDAVARIALQCLRLLRSYPKASDEKNWSTKELVSMSHQLDKVVSSSILEDAHPSLRIMVTSAVAMQVSLQVALRRYDKAQRILETMLSIGILHVSDQLWSQLVMLRSTVPLRSVASLKPLAEAAERCEVWFNHLTLPGDKSLQLKAREPGNEEMSSLTPQLTSVQHSKEEREKTIVMINQITQVIAESMTDSVDIDLASVNLSSTVTHFAVPSCLLMTGFAVRQINLSGCSIKELPAGFGNHFPSLEILSLSQNLLSRIQNGSLDKLVSLKQLDVSGNQLIELGTGIGSCTMLEELLSSNNKLSTLPDSVIRCKKLWYIDISSNLFEQRPMVLFHLECLSALRE